MTTTAAAPAVELFSWNPRLPRFPGRWGAATGLERPVNNFGDLLGPVVVRHLLRQLGAGEPVRDARLMSVGSVLHFAAAGDVVWGTGVNGKIAADRHAPETVAALDVRAVRGPLTRDFLRSRGADVPAVYGDPGLLVPHVLPRVREWAQEKRFDVTVLPNLNDTDRSGDRRARIDPRRPLMKVLERIARSRLVVGSSLHAIIVAESLGIPARLVRPENENPFKYDDYYAGTGRPEYTSAPSVSEAIAMGGERGLEWSPQPLLDAFPRDLWR